MGLFKFIKDIIIGKRRKYNKVLVVTEASNNLIKKDTIVIIKAGDNFKWAKFMCPCGCKNQVMLSLNPVIKPYWSIELNNITGKEVVTLNPSIFLTGYTCKSHFFIKNNKVLWI